MPIILALLAIIGFLIHLYFTKHERSKKYTIELLLSYFLLFILGINGIISSIALMFFPSSTASLMGLENGSFFQFEVGIANLSFGVLGILCIYIRMKHFWLSTIIGASIFLWGNAIGLIREMISSKTFVSGILSSYFYHDIFFPLILIGLYISLLLMKKEIEIPKEEKSNT